MSKFFLKIRDFFMHPDLRETVSSLNSQLAELKATADTQYDQIQTYREQRDEFGHKAYKSGKRVLELERDLEEKERQCEEQGDTIDSLQNEVDGVDKTFDKVRDLVDRLESALNA